MRVSLGYTLGTANPFVSLLTSALTTAGVIVTPQRASDLLRGHVDIWHLQWPTAVAQRRSHLGRMAGMTKMVVLLAACKLRDIKVVWTVHNLENHETRNPHSQRLLLRALTNSVDGWISLSDEAASEIAATVDGLGKRPHWVIPHGHYRSAYPKPPPIGTARRTLGIPSDTDVLLYFGLIRDYKNLPALVNAVRVHPNPNLRLIIAGDVQLSDSSGLISSIKQDGRILFLPGFVPASDVPTLFAAADLCVLPFSRVLNSGSALLSLSMNTPVLLPRIGSMMRLHADVGDPWVTLYEGHLTSRELERGLHSAKSCPSSTAPLDAYSWDLIGQQTALAYEELRGS